LTTGPNIHLASTLYRAINPSHKLEPPPKGILNTVQSLRSLPIWWQITGKPLTAFPCFLPMSKQGESKYDLTDIE